MVLWYGKVVVVFVRRTLVWCLLVSLAAGCKAQSPSSSASTSASPVPTSQLNRRIEVLVRSQFDVPPNVEVTIGATTKSDFPGFENLPITFAKNGKQSVVNFLLSSDGNTVARLEKFDISHNPADTISIQNRPLRGTPDAKVTIVNFDDLECPYCARMHAQLFPDTLDRYKDQVRVVYKDYPLIEIHPWALRAAIDANCLAAQNPNAYWNYVDYLHKHGDDVTGPDRDPAKSAATLDKLARDEGQRSKLDTGKLDACLTKQDDSVVRSSLKEGDSLGVDGTPTLFINGERLSGALPESQVWLAIDRALKSEGVTPPPPPPSPSTGAAKTPGDR